MTVQEVKNQDARDWDRLQQYRSILKDNPLYTAIERVETDRKPWRDTRLYLYTCVPALVEFVSWVLDKAAGSGKRRLYFLSRDGYQMYLVALRLAELRQLHIECRYLHVSRYSMRLPQYHLDLAGSIDRICSGGIDVTLERILQRAALSPEEVSEVIRTIGWQDKSRDILNYRQIQKLKKTLRDRTNILQYVKQHSLTEYGNAMGYLEQEGLLSDIPYAIVDSGWVGTLQESIRTMVQSERPEIEIEGYYFGMYEIPEGTDTRRYHAWYFSGGSGLKRKAGFSNSLFETVCSADEGMTMYYREKQGNFQPVKALGGNPNGPQLKRNLEALNVFLAELKDFPAVLGDMPSARKNVAAVQQKNFSARYRDGIRLAERLFTLFMSRPTETEVLSYGDSLFSDDVLEGNQKRAAAELTEKEIRNQRFFNRLLIAAGIRKVTIQESAWIEGSIVRCGKHVKRNLAHARLYKYLVFARKQWRQDGRER